MAAWTNSERDEIVKALAVVCELTAANLTNPAKQFFVRELENYETEEVLLSLRRCARECKNRLALADVIERIDEAREKDKASRRAQASIEETRLRGAALGAGIPWELGKEKVRELLAKAAKSLPLSDEAKEQARQKSIEHARHWTETEKE